MDEKEIKDIQKEVKPYETRMFTIALQGEDEYIISTLYITSEDYWVEEQPLTIDEFIELFS